MGSGLSRERRRDLILRAYAAGIARVAPDAAVRDILELASGGIAVDSEALPVPGRLIVVAIGKAAAPMASAAMDTLGERIDAGYTNGVLTLRIPLSERAKPRRVEIRAGDDTSQAIESQAVDTTYDHQQVGAGV